MLSNYPDYGKAPPEYLLSLAEYVATLTIYEQNVLADPKSGIATRCSWLPTIADMAKLLAETSAKNSNPVYPYKAFAPEPEVRSSEAEMERRRRLARETLARHGFPWNDKGKQIATLPLDKFKSSADCKSPDGPVSDELRAQLEASAWPYFQREAAQ